MGVGGEGGKKSTEMSGTICACALFVGRKGELGSNKMTGLQVRRVGGWIFELVNRTPHPQMRTR